MLAVDQRGVPRLEFDAPARPAATSKSGRWLRGLEACAELAAEIGNVPLISVMDREGNCFELCRQPRSRVELLVRAQHNRRLGDQLPKLFDRMRAAPAQVRVELSLDRISARGGAHRGREARIARLAVKWRQVEVPAPRRNEPAVTLWAVHAIENPPPQGAAPVEWLLLTSLPVTDRQQALQLLEWYRLRWRIEDWFRLLKTGCRVEALQLRQAESLQRAVTLRAVTLRAVIAWRLAALTRLGHDTPELPTETMLTDIELTVLQGLACDDPRSPPPNDLGKALLAIAMLGGFQNRRSDRPPGYEMIWKGYTALVHQADAYQRLIRLAQRKGPDYVYKLLRPDK